MKNNIIQCMSSFNPILNGGSKNYTLTHFFELLLLIFLHEIFTQGTKFYISHFRVKKFVLGFIQIFPTVTSSLKQSKPIFRLFSHNLANISLFKLKLLLGGLICRIIM